MAREDRAKERNLADERKVDVRDQQIGVDETGGGGHGRAFCQVGDDLAQEQRTAGTHHVDGNADEGNVRLELEGEEAHEKAHKDADGKRRQKTPDPVCVVGDKGTGQSREHHKTFKTDVAEACLFDYDGGQRRKQDRRGNADDGEEKLRRQQHLQKIKHVLRLLSGPRAQPWRQAPPVRS